ncbi:ap-1 complex subunit gamma [Anaeramoeba flamelloides]|uniref:AP-1 complex subunit gamma n=1 Tax=Anaeramoeba flamelloides TaxID=1746091 RepID=A0ABQ8Y2Y1_9EUKA|nr:ap-1 complex subunit gamma [Anaeramoeba flamelloides]
MSLKLHDLITKVRESSTTSSTREIISQECVQIRNAFRKEDTKNRPRNISKLIYIDFLGFPTDFGQVECLKLIAQPSYVCKRIGYLGLSVLLTENEEVLFMSTNIIRSDLASENKFIVALALSSLGNIGSVEMLRDLAPEVEKLLKSQAAYIRKKAALTAIRTIRFVPETVDRFVGCVKSLLSDKNHGVVLGGLQLLVEILKIEPKTISEFRKLVPGLLRMLKSLVDAGYAPEYDFEGVTDPFLQVYILRLLRILGQDSKKYSNQMIDILTQVGTSSGLNKNVENCILYESVSTILTIDSPNRLRVTAINTLSKFLTGKDNNMKYVALNTLLKGVNKDSKSLKRHRKVIVKCLRDKDISIRRRALDLVFGIMNKKNVKELTQELLDCLPKAEHDFRFDITAKVCTAIERFSPDDQWQIDTLVQVLTIGGQYIRDDVIAIMTQVTGRNRGLQYYASKKLYNSLLDDRYRNQKFIQVAAWVIGEFGDILLKKSIEENEPIDPSQIIDLCQIIITSSRNEDLTKYFVLNTLIKLSTRIEGYNESIKEIIKPFMKHVNIEIQQRACEYFRLFEDKELLVFSFDRIPVKDDNLETQKIEEIEENSNQNSNTNTKVQENSNNQLSPNNNNNQNKNKQEENELNLMGSNINISQNQTQESSSIENLLQLDFSNNNNQNVNKQTTNTQNQQSNQSTEDFLSDIFGTNNNPNRSVNNTQNIQNNNIQNVMDLLGTGKGNGTGMGRGNGFGMGKGNGTGMGRGNGAGMGRGNGTGMGRGNGTGMGRGNGTGMGRGNVNTQKKNPSAVIYNQDGLKIQMNFKLVSVNGTPAAMIQSTFTNSTQTQMTGLLFQVAVPKHLQVQMAPPSSKIIPPNNNGKVTQTFRIIKKQNIKTKLTMMTRIQFKINGMPISKQQEVKNLPLIF